MATAFGLPQLLSLYDPSVGVDQIALERQMAMAQALRQQSLDPINPNRQIGGMGYRVSPLEAVAKVFQAMQAGRMDQQNDQERLGLMQRMGQAYAQALRGDSTVGATQAPAPVSDVSDPNGGRPMGVSAQSLAQGGFPQPAPGSPSAPSASPSGPATPMPGTANPFSMANVLRGGMISSLGGDAAGAAYWDNAKTPDAIKVLQMTGQNPQTVGDLNTGKLRKEANAPTRLGPNAYADNTGNVHYVPDTIEGSINIPDPTVPGGFRTVQVPGAPKAIYAKSEATAGGKAEYTPFAGFDALGHPKPLQSVASALRAGAQSPTAQPSAPGVATVTVPPGQGPSQTAMGGTYGAQPLGTESEQKAIDDSWKGIMSRATNAQNVKSYIDNIVKAGQSGAIIGPNADRRETIEGLLYLSHINKTQEDQALSQTQLLDKYHNQIVSWLGQGALGTDAARALVDSAYPGKQMNLSALQEAAANVNGAQDMAKAEQSFLMPSKIARDSATFQQKQMQFEQNADPRIFQWMAIQNPDQRKAFLQSVLQQDPSFFDRAKKLREIGAIQ